MAEGTDVAARQRAVVDISERSAAEIRHDIAAKRESISETVDKLGERIHESLDWREYVAEYPYVALGITAGLGLLASGIFKPHPSPRDRIMDAIAETVEDFTDRAHSTIEEVVDRKKTGPVRIARTAVGTIIGKAVTDFAKGKIQEALEQRNRRSRSRNA